MFKYDEKQEIVGSSKTHMYECPNCGAEDLDYDPQEFVDEKLISQVCRCKDCGFSFTNFYTIKYTGFAAHDIDFDEEGEVM
jgi:uncharacterized Zn finger protein